VKKETADGTPPTGVMHACGLDLQMASVTAAGIYLAQHRDQWKGTLMMIGQPAEARGSVKSLKVSMGGGLILQERNRQLRNPPKEGFLRNARKTIRIGQPKIVTVVS
jgi:hypothetical protein